MPAASGSLGDQAMLESVVDNLHVLGMTSFRQILLPKEHLHNYRVNLVAQG